MESGGSRYAQVAYSWSIYRQEFSRAWTLQMGCCSGSCQIWVKPYLFSSVPSSILILSRLLQPLPRFAQEINSVNLIGIRIGAQSSCPQQLSLPFPFSLLLPSFLRGHINSRHALDQHLRNVVCTVCKGDLAVETGQSSMVWMTIEGNCSLLLEASGCHRISAHPFVHDQLLRAHFDHYLKILRNLFGTIYFMSSSSMLIETLNSRCLNSDISNISGGR